MPEVGIRNFLYEYPEPGFIILIDLIVRLESVLNLWIPLGFVAVDIPIVLIPIPFANASDWLLCNLTVLGLTTKI